MAIGIFGNHGNLDDIDNNERYLIDKHDKRGDDDDDHDRLGWTWPPRSPFAKEWRLHRLCLSGK